MPTPVQSANAGTWNNTLVASKSAAAFAANVTAGNFLVAEISYDSGATISSVTLGGQAATLLASVTDTTNAQIDAIYYVANAAGGTTASGTVNFTATGNFIAVNVTEYSGVATATPADGSGVIFVSPANTTGTTAAFTPTTSGDLLFLCSAWGATVTPNTPTGTNTTFALRQQVGTGGSDTATADGTQTTAASTTATWTWTTSANNAMVLGAFKPSAAAPLLVGQACL